ncbi:MAG: chalcone isomerase family protein [Desulfosalsimonas sp.]
MLKKIVILLLVSVMSASAGHARTTEGVEMPETIEIGDKKVALNGAGVRKIIEAKYYVGGLYLREASTDENAVTEADEPMAIRLEMVEDADQETMQRAFLNGLRGATDNNIDPIQDQIDQFMDCFSDSIKDGDVFEFRYAPKEGTKVYKSGEQLAVIEGFDFKKAMFGIWLSDKPADRGLKKDMLAGDFRVAMEDIRGEEKEVAEAGQEEPEASEEKEAEEQETLEQEAAEERKVAEKESDIEKQEQEAAKEKPEAEAEKEAEDKKTAQAEAGSGGAAAAAGSKSGDAGGDDEQEARADAEQKDKETKQAAKEEQKAEKRAAREKQKAEKAEKQKAEEQKASAEKKAGTSATRSEVEGENVYFETNDASLNEKAVDRLEKKAAWLEKNPDAVLSVQVYCDPRGSEDYNTWLAKQRGRSVRKWFTGRDIDESRIYIKVRGAEALKGGGEKDWSKSRRAEFRIVE